MMMYKGEAGEQPASPFFLTLSACPQDDWSRDSMPEARLRSVERAIRDSVIHVPKLFPSRDRKGDVEENPLADARVSVRPFRCSGCDATRPANRSPALTGNVSYSP